jgi:hypothetical protein
MRIVADDERNPALIFWSGVPFAFGVLTPMRADKSDNLPDWLPPKSEEPADVAEPLIEEYQPEPIVEPKREDVWIAA